jgi:hypothetical protein
MLDKLVKPKKAKSRIFVAELGIVIDVKFVDFQNAPGKMDNTVLGITYEVFSDADGYNINVFLDLLNNIPFSDIYWVLVGATTMLVRLVPAP